MNSMGSGFFSRLAQSVVTSIIGLLLCCASVSASFAAMFPIATSGAAGSYSFDGSKYLVGIENHLTPPTNIGAQMLNADGTKYGSLISTGRTGIATNVAFDGTNYLLTWEDDNLGAFNGSTGWQVWGQLIGKTGVAVSNPFAISSTGIWFDGVKSMAFGGGKYLVTYTKLIVPANGDASNNRYIAGRIVNPDGSVGSEFRISTGFGKASDVAFDGTNFFVVWCEDFADQEIRGRFVSPAGVPGTEISVNASAAPSDNPNSVTFDGTNYLVVWNDEVGGQGTGTWDAFGQLVSPGGTLVGGVITITNEPGPQMVTSVAFDGSNYLAVWIDMTNDANGNAVCDVGEGSCWDMYGQYLSRNGTKVGGKITISTDTTNQMGGVGFVNGKYLVLVNSGVTMGQGGIIQVASANGLFVTPPTSQYSGSGTYAYTGNANGGTLSWTWTDLNFICNGPSFGPGTQTITLLSDTTLTWTDSDGGMTWSRPAGTAGDITGTWKATEPGSGNSYTLTFNPNGSVSVSADIFRCSSNGQPSIASFSPVSGIPGNLVTISGTNFSPLADNNTVLFNGVPAVVTGVQSSKLFVLVPPGATTGTISVMNSGGTATSIQSFTVPTGTKSASMVWGSVHNRNDSDGSIFDALDVGINSYATTLAGMTVTVSGPNNFSYTFSDADISPYINGQLALYKKYPTPATPLAPGVYTFTMNDGQGHISHRVDAHVTVSTPLPKVDSTTIQLQRKADGSYRFSWAPLNDTKTYHYRIRIYRNDTANTPIYDSARLMVSYADLPAGILFDDSTYRARVEAVDSPNGDLATSSSRSAWKLFSPKQSDYDANKLLTNFAAVYNRTDGTGTLTYDANLSVSDPSKVTSILLTGPAGFSQPILTTDVTNRTNDGTTVITDFYKNFPTGTTMPAGLYTFTFQTALGGTQTAYATLTAPVSYPVVDSTTMQTEDLGNGNVRFSWANVNHTGALYYRAVLNSQAKSLSYNTSRLNQTFIDVPTSIISSLSPTRWRVEVIDGSDTTTQRNRFNTAWKTLSIPAYDAAKPVIGKFRIRNMINEAGAAYSHVSVDTNGPQSILTQILVTGPGGYSRDLLSVGRYSPAGGSYTLEGPGTLTTGLYTITVGNAAGSTTRYMYVPAVNALPRPDYKTFHNDLEPNGDMRVSWAPVASNVPVWYSLNVYAQTDLNSDGLMDPVYSISQNGSNNLQLSSISIPSAAIALWPQYAMVQISAFDGSGYSVVSSNSQSVMVAAEMPGFNYATLVNADGDGFANDVDLDANRISTDNNAAVYPFSTGNDALATAVTGTNPTDKATGIPTTGGAFSVTFNKVIDQRSLPASFTLNNGITGTVLYNPATRTATFVPLVPLLTGTTYTATISTGLLDQAGHALSVPYSWSFTAAGNLPSLTVSVTGNGNINSNTGSPGIHAAAPGSYSSPYAWNESVTLTATLSTGWDFDGWGGDGTCVGTGLTCTFAMNSNRTVTATFLAAVQDNARLNNGSTPYGTVLDAYNAASAPGTVIKLRDIAFPEALDADNGTSVIISGGYPAGFGPNHTGITSITGLIVRLGNLTIDNLTIK